MPALRGAFFFFIFLAFNALSKIKTFFKHQQVGAFGGMSLPTCHACEDSLRNPPPPVRCVVGYVGVYSPAVDCPPRLIRKWVGTKLDSFPLTIFQRFSPPPPHTQNPQIRSFVSWGKIFLGLFSYNSPRERRGQGVPRRYRTAAVCGTRRQRTAGPERRGLLSSGGLNGQERR